MDNEKALSCSEEHGCGRDDHQSNNGTYGCGCGCGCGCGGEDGSGAILSENRNNQYVTLILPDNSILECPVIAIFQNYSLNYIALMHPVEKTVLLFRCYINQDRTIELEDIEDDEEYEAISELFASKYGYLLQTDQ